MVAENPWQSSNVNTADLDEAEMIKNGSSNMDEALKFAQAFMDHIKDVPDEDLTPEDRSTKGHIETFFEGGDLGSETYGDACDYLITAAKESSDWVAAVVK